jgi:hypothetical protein
VFGKQAGQTADQAAEIKEGLSIAGDCTFWCMSREAQGLTLISASMGG